MNFLRTSILLFLFASTPISRAHAEPFTALKDGERFRYQIGWGMFSNAGEIAIEAARDTLDGREIFRVKTKIASRGVIRGLFRFDNRGELTIDAATGRVLTASDGGESGSKRVETRTVFDYVRRIATHTDAVKPDRNRDFPIPDGNPVDLISALIRTRDWKPHLGEYRDALVYFGRDLYPVTLRAENRETIKTPLGTFSTIQLIPRMETEPPRGVFKRGGEIKVWVSETSEPLPVQMQLNLSFGTARLSLVEHSVHGKTTKSD